MDSKYLSDSEVNPPLKEVGSVAERRRNISAESCLFAKKEPRDGRISENDHTVTKSSMRDQDAPPGPPKSADSCSEIPRFSIPPLPKATGSNEAESRPRDDRELESLGNSNQKPDANSPDCSHKPYTSLKKSLRISIEDYLKDCCEGFGSSDESGDFVMDLSPMEPDDGKFFGLLEFAPDRIGSVNRREEPFNQPETSEVEREDESSIAENGSLSVTKNLGDVKGFQEDIGSLKNNAVNQPNEGESSRNETSSPYGAFQSATGVGDSIIGRPRCVALKQKSFDQLEDLELDFDFELTDEPVEEVIDEEVRVDQVKKRKVADPDDMFQDDDSDVQKHSHPEMEEGELPPDVHSSSHPGDVSRSKSSVESNLELFEKVNRCFFELDREFNNILVPRRSKKLIGHLQDTLKIVRRMDRKLSVLIDSVDGKGDRDSKFSKAFVAVEAKVAAKSSNKGNESKNSPSRKGSKGKDGKSGSPDSRSSRRETRRRDKSRPNRTEERSSIKRGSGNKEARNQNERCSMNMNPLEARKEKQRIQSLFKRQMNMITQHVIHRNIEAKRREMKSAQHSFIKSTKNLEVSEKIKVLDEVKTLEDMEVFLQVLKEKKHGKTGGSGFMDYRKKQSGLIFTTKKTTNSEWRAILEKSRIETKNKMAASLLPGTEIGDNLGEKETISGNLEETKEIGRKIDVEILDKKELETKNSVGEQMVKHNSSKPPDAVETEMADLSSPKDSIEQRRVKRRTEREKERPTVRIEFQTGEKVNDSFLVRRKNLKEIGPIQESEGSDFESDRSPKKSGKRTKKRKHSEPKSSESDSESGDQISLKRRRKSELSPENDVPSISRRYRSTKEKIDYPEDRFPGKLKPQNLFIVADKNLSLLDKHFYLTVKGNQIFLEMKKRSPTRGKHRESKEKHDLRDPGNTLKEMEEFLQQLRSKKASVEEHQPPSPSDQEAKFIARVQAKRKAKLMACISPSMTEKEVRVLRDLEMRAREPCDSPETLSRKQELLQKIRAETEAIVTSQKQRSAVDDDPLRALLSMIREDESVNKEQQQVLVSFPLKKTDTKGHREGTGGGAAYVLSEESQKLLNSVRAKMRAKKTVSEEGSEKKQ